MVFKAIILLTCLVSAHAAIQCRAGAGASAGSHDAKATINYKDCDEGVTQCMLTGVKVKKVAAFTYGCGEKDKVNPLGCKQGTLKSTCYCTGTKCVPPNPTDEEAAIKPKPTVPTPKPTPKPTLKPKKNSANTVGTQVTIVFALFLAFFSKIMA